MENSASYIRSHVSVCVGAEDGPSIQASFEEKSGERTVPKIFVGGSNIGGYSEI